MFQLLHHRHVHKEKTEEKEDFFFSVFKAVLITLPILLFLKWLMPDVIPFGVFEFWKLNPLNILGAMISFYPLLIYGFGVQFLFSVFRNHNHSDLQDAEEHFGMGVLISAMAGFFEELLFRWIYFLSAMIGLQVANFLCFGFISWMFGDWFSWVELPRLLYTYILIPLADFFTLGYLHSLLVTTPWWIGAAIISTNGRFRNEHAYLGIYGYINSWYGGMIFYVVVFSYGLPAAMCLHFLYDVCVFWGSYVAKVLHRKYR